MSLNGSDFALKAEIDTRESEAELEDAQEKIQGHITEYSKSINAIQGVLNAVEELESTMVEGEVVD